MPGQVTTDYEVARFFEGDRRLHLALGGDRYLGGYRIVVGLSPKLVPILNFFVTENEFVVDRIAISDYESDLLTHLEIERLRRELGVLDDQSSLFGYGTGRIAAAAEQ
jgi:hypothetical protein